MTVAHVHHDPAARYPTISENEGAAHIARARIGVAEVRLTVIRPESAAGPPSDPVLARLHHFLGNPAATLMQLRLDLRTLGAEVAINRAASLDERARAAELLREQAIERARKAAEEASGFFSAGGLFGKLAVGFACVAAVTGAIMSGGALAIAAAAVGSALVLGSDEITAIAVELGLPEEDAMYFKLGVEIAGGLLMTAGPLVAPTQTVAVAGAGAQVGVSAGAAASSVSDITRACEVINTVSGVASGASKAADGGFRIGGSVARAESEGYAIDATAHEGEAERAVAEMSEQSEHMAQIEAVARRMVGVIRMSVRALEEGRRSAASMLA